MGRLGINAGRIAYRTSGRLALATCCCGPCNYEASSGNEYTDDFAAALDAGWTAAGSPNEWETSGGKLQWTGTFDGFGTPSGPLQLYRERNPLGAWTKIIAEINVNRLDADTDHLLLYLSDSGVGVGPKLRARFDTGDFLCETTTDSLVVSQTPADGDLLSIRLDPTGPNEGDKYGACFSINGTPVAFLGDTSVDFSDVGLLRHGVQLTGGGVNFDGSLGQFDNYTSQVDT